MVHEFIENVLDNTIKYYAFLGIEYYRQILKRFNFIDLKRPWTGFKSYE